MRPGDPINLYAIAADPDKRWLAAQSLAVTAGEQIDVTLTENHVADSSVADQLTATEMTILQTEECMDTSGDRRWRPLGRWSRIGSQCARDNKEGPFRRRWYAQYQYKKYVACIGNDGAWICWNEWRPRIWTGDMKRSKVALSVPALDYGHDILLSKGEIFRRDEKANRQYGVGLRLAGLGLGSQAGYSSVTKLKWVGRTGCRFRHLYGVGSFPTESRTVYARSRDC